MWFLRIRKLLRNRRFQGAALAALVIVVNFAAMACGCGAETDENSGFVREQIRETSDAAALPQEEGTGAAAPAETEESPAEDIYVYVCGAVEREGVVRLPERARVFEALEAAGGLTQDAAKDAVNQAAVLSDAAMLRIPTAAEAEERDPAQNTAPAAVYAAAPVQGGAAYGVTAGLINLNTAGKDELMTLSGIGEVKAERILAYRKEHGEFSRVEDLLQVSGIGEKSLDKFRDAVTVR